jgi:hypothetical protein
MFGDELQRGFRSGGIENLWLPQSLKPEIERNSEEGQLGVRLFPPMQVKRPEEGGRDE